MRSRFSITHHYQMIRNKCTEAHHQQRVVLCSNITLCQASYVKLSEVSMIVWAYFGGGKVRHLHQAKGINKEGCHFVTLCHT